ncbi:tetratricopeptide repeat protein [Motiliproteus sp. MSK22-1]|uniref:tetratricopeptide repeat protein n=1 Tax=Motiliproteus sp. MSK22-1 TaxID=1897630 RepID=UPI0009775E14|nr:tetratricopeptide repeat protein [Motiliproteus sp. MSK22-1]OMH32755.1 hypothetical protein BGP75_14615 [Motiliproteus sp. MSK22-1]
MIKGLEKLLAAGKDSPELRFGLGNAYLKAGDFEAAALHLQACVEQKPEYTAAWKLLGKAFQQQDKLIESLDTYRRGISVALQQGDLQAEKEMNVFCKRLERQLQSESE